MRTVIAKLILWLRMRRKPRSVVRAGGITAQQMSDLLKTAYSPEQFMPPPVFDWTKLSKKDHKP